MTVLYIGRYHAPHHLSLSDDDASCPFRKYPYLSWFSLNHMHGFADAVSCDGDGDDEHVCT